MSKSMTLRVLTPEKAILETENLTKIRVPLVDDAPIGIRPGHHPLIAETCQGMVFYQTASQTNHIELHAGVLEIRDDNITIFTAGEVSDVPQEITTGASDETYDRLMETLISQLYLEEKSAE